jgi:hypothetical protein
MVTAALDPDLFGSASHRNMATHLTAPFATGAVESPVPIAATGAAAVDFVSREPLLLCALRADLAEAALAVEATLPDGTTTALEFAPWTERGAALPLYRPPTESGGFSDPFDLKLGKLREIAPNRAATALPNAEIAERLELELVEGILGRLIYATSAEKQRLRRLGRELSAMRRLRSARDDALDRLGAELGVPRLADDLAFRGGHVVTDVRREPDEEYRRRLAIYRPWLLRTRANVLGLLKGIDDRLSVAERDNPFALAVHVVGAEEPATRDNFLEFVRRVHLIWPHPTADPVHAARFEPEERRQQVEAMRANLRDGFSIVTSGPSSAFAPMLASSLARVSRCRKHLRATTKWPVNRAQDGAAGSRYELGLGADLQPLPAAELDRLAQEHAGGRPAADPEVQALLDAMTPRSAADDPAGRWLLEPCGLRTVHRVDANNIYVSHLPAFGLAITGPAQVKPTGWTQIVPGSFAAGSPFTGLLFYERATGTGAFHATDGRGGITPLTEHTNWRTTWTRIVPGEFGGQRGATDLLLYERPTGTAEIWTTDGAGGIALVRQHTDWRRTWTQIVTGRFAARPATSPIVLEPPGAPRRSDVLLYDRAAGEIELHAVDPLGATVLLGRHGDARRTWSHIVPGDFVTDSGFTDLAFYDRAAGLLELWTTDGAGGLSLLRRHAHFGRGWTHVVAGRFGGRRGSDLMFYDRASGRAGFYRVEDDGGVTPQREHGLGRAWSQVVAGNFGGDASADLLLYSRSAGTAELHLGDGAWGLVPLRRHAGWRRSSATPFEARYHAPGDPGTNVVLATGLGAADAEWRGQPHNGPAWTVLNRAQTVEAWRTAAPRPGNDPALGVLRAAGLPALADPRTLVEQLERLPEELVVAIRLAPAQAQTILAGDAAASRKLHDLVGVLRAHHVASVLPLLASQDNVVLLLGAIGLPEAGTNLQDRRSTGFRWYALPLDGGAAEVTSTGSRALFAPSEAGVYVLAVVGYARTGDTDPYEFRVELPEGALLDLRSYELLMNMLDHVHPAGVEVNTYSIRKEHVDLDGDGAADPLSPAVARTYRAFRRRRHRGEVGVTLPEPRPGG